MAKNDIYLIKDLAQTTGQSIHTIKYYLKIGLIQEAARSPETNFRYFDDSTVERLKQIRAMRLQSKSLREIKGILEQKTQYELF